MLESAHLSTGLNSVKKIFPPVCNEFAANLQLFARINVWAKQAKELTLMDFSSELHALDGLYQEVTTDAGAKRMICGFAKTSNNTVRLVVSNARYPPTSVTTCFLFVL